jgi:RNA polymerase sigma factor (sigma-70 family)
MWEEQERRNPVLAAPGSNDYSGLIASSTTRTSGREVGKLQVLSDKEANDLCERYLPLAYNTAGLYIGRGVGPDEVRSASVAGLFEASRRYDPQRGPFAPYAKLWCKGEIKALFKPGKDALGRSFSLNIPAFKDDSDGESFLDRFVTDETTPGLNPDVSDLSEKERRVILGRISGETLSETGKALDLSPERVRQIEVRASDRLRKSKGCVARGAISDLVKRRGYQKLYLNFRSLEDSRLKQTKYPGRHYSKVEIEAYKPQECLPPANVPPPLWALPTSSPRPSKPKIKIKRGGRWCTLERAGESYTTDAETEGRALVNALRLNKDTRIPILREQESALELGRHRNESLGKLNGLGDSYEPELSKNLKHHQKQAITLAALRGNDPLRNPKGPYGGPVIHAQERLEAGTLTDEEQDQLLEEGTALLQLMHRLLGSERQAA